MNLVNWRGSLKYKFEFSDHSFTHFQSKDGRIRCPVDRNLEIFLTSHAQFLFIFGQCVDHCK